jgi:tetratricopeptide (TPR) repeat protein
VVIGSSPVIVTMLAFPAMIRLHAAVIPALCLYSCTAVYAHDIDARPLLARNIPTLEISALEISALEITALEITAPDIAAPDIAATVLANRNIAARYTRAREELAPYLPARGIRVQDLPPDLTREQVLSALGSRDDDVRYGAYVALGVLGKHEDLPLLFSALYDNDKLVRKIAEEAIWKVWGRSGNAAYDRLYRHGVEQMQAGELTGAVGSFTTLIQLDPDFSEAWNKRATLYFMLGENDLSIADCDEVLSREPNHFGALSGYGLLMLREGDYRRALEYFEQALTANPNMPGVRRNIEMITEHLEEQGGDDI